MNRVYFLTSCHYNPEGPDFAPLCLVWIGLDHDHTIIVGRVYKSYNLPKMLSLARKMAQDKNLPLTVLSVDPVIAEIYTRERGPLVTSTNETDLPVNQIDRFCVL